MADSEQPTPPTPEAPAKSLGELLRAARLAQDLTLPQLATELRIEAKQLDALEQDRFEQIGVPVFVKGYLRQYGTRLGLDVNDLLALYHKQTTLVEVQIQPSPTIRLRDERQITSWVLAAVVLLSVAVGLSVWWWNGGTFDLNALMSVTSEPVASAPKETPAVRSVTSPPAASPAQSAVAVEPEAAVPATATSPAASSESLAGEAQQGGEIIGAPAVAPAGDDADRDAAAATIPLEFSFEQESWVEVTDGRGERLLFGLNAAGRTMAVRGEPPFSIVLGNADGVRLAVNGEPYEIPIVGRQGNLARFAVGIAEE